MNRWAKRMWLVLLSSLSHKGGIMFLSAALFSLSLLQAVESELLTARVELDASQQSSPISRHLFGKFTEHLGRNVYLGMWAQLVPNPEFAPVSAWPEAENLMRNLKQYYSDFQWPGDPPDSGQQGIAPYWSAQGTLTGQVDKFGVGYLQRVLTGDKGGKLQTGIYPPFYRVSSLALGLKARSRVSTIVHLSVLDSGKIPVARTVISLSPEMSTIEDRLELKEGVSVAKGEPCLLVLEFEADVDVQLSRIQIFPDDHVQGWEPEVVEYMRNARLPMLRFPGGNFASGYHWEDGVGSLESRPVLPNPAWKGVMEWNHVGTDEWLALCELTGAEPLICVNAGNGTAEEASRWVEYCNGGTDTPMGRLRAQNGHPASYKVRYWEIGNELYGSWQIGHTGSEGYAKRYDDFVRAIEKVDSGVLFIANGRDPEWNRTLVRRAVEPVRSISVHSLPGGGIPAEADPRIVFREFMAHADGYEDYLHSVASPMTEAGLRANLAVTELQVFTNRPSLPNNATLTEALWTAGILHACIRSGIVELLTHSAMLNHGGGLRKVRGVVYPNPVWWTTHLYGTSEGVIPTAVAVRSPTFSTEGKWLTARENVPYLDASALLSPDGTKWILFLINRHVERAIQADIILAEFEAASEVQITTLTGKSFMSRNEWDATEVQPLFQRATVRSGSLKHRLLPISLTRFTFTAASAQK